MEQVRDEFLRIWPDFRWIKVSERLMRQAGQLIFKHGLRGYDSVHLASALLLKEHADGLDLFFSSLEKNLNQAALRVGFIIHQKVT